MMIVMGSSPKDSGSNRRRAPRFELDAQSSSLGTVKDLSRVGARVAGNGRPPLTIGETLTLCLRATDGAVLQLPSRVVWIRKPKFRQWEIGLEFVGIDRRKQTLIECLARFGTLAPPATPVASGSSGEGTRIISEHDPSAGGQGPPLQARYRERDHYRILQVQPDADGETIRLAFRMLAKRLHPDRNPAPDAHRRFELLKQAYDILRDPERRQRYDAALAELRVREGEQRRDAA